MRKVTSAQWAWRGDTGWIDYDSKMNLHIESEFLEGVQRITVDGERFVDVSLSPKQIRVKWYCADVEDKDCIGLQRRFDDETKRRAVRRRVEPFLKGVNLTLLLSEDDLDYVTKMVTFHKATVRPNPTKRTSFLILGTGMTPDDFPEEIKFAGENDIPVVTEDWLAECCKKAELLLDEVDNYLVKLPDAAAAAVEEEAAPAPVAVPAAEEPKHDDDDDEKAGPPPAKKIKTADPAADADKMEVEPDTASTTTGRYPINANSMYMGTMTTDGSVYPFIMEIKSIISGAVEGIMIWPTFNRAELKMRGVVLGNRFQFTEYEVLKGEEDVEPGTEYTAAINHNVISGTTQLDDVKGTFTATLIDSNFVTKDTAAENSTHFTAKSTYKGTCVTETEFELTVAERTGDIVKGTINWPSLNYSTNFEGEIVGSQLKFHETSVAVAGEGAAIPTLPTLYSGNLESGGLPILKGSVASSKGNGSFTIKLTP